MNRFDRPDLSPGLRRRAEALAGSRAPEERDPASMLDMRAALHELQVHQIELEMQNEELLRVQGKLEDARARYYDLYDLAPVGYLIMSPEGRILEVNQTAVALLGAAQSTLVGQPITRFIQDQDQDIYYLYRKQFLQTGEIRGRDLRLVRPDGTVFWAHLAAGAGPGLNRVVLVDITERKRIEAALKRSEAALAATQTLTKVGSWEWEVRDQTMTWSREMYRLYQLTPGGPAPGPVPLARGLACYLPEDRAALQAAFTRCLERGEPYSLKCRITTAKGRPRWIRTQAKAVAENGAVVRVIGYMLEIAERRHHARAVKAGPSPLKD
jgi:PAS domain S-box-containing protein